MGEKINDTFLPEQTAYFFAMKGVLKLADITKLVPIEYSSVRVITTEQLAQVYECDPKIISNNFKRNSDHFVIGTHYYLLEGQNLKAFKGIHQNDESLKFVSKLYLWTKRGDSRHSKMLGTDKAWEMFDLLEENYFTPRPQPVEGKSDWIAIPDLIQANKSYQSNNGCQWARSDQGYISKRYKVERKHEGGRVSAVRLNGYA